MADRWTQWIYADAPKYGIDPEAAWAISMNEWSGRRGTGDQGTSFGPFMLHAGGALPRGRGRKWAESRAGVNYALRKMAESGARGLRGRRAVGVIASKFEKPADVAHEIEVAMAHYGRSGIRGRQAGLASLARNTATGQLPGVGADRLAMIGSLLSSINPDVSPIISMAAARAQQPQPQDDAIRPSPRRIGGGRLGEIAFDSGADRAGVHTRQPVLNFARRIAGLSGQTIHIGTGTNHSQMTVNGNVSDHWHGNAVDIPASGTALIRLGRNALIAAGMPRAQAMKQKGGLYNVNGHQIIFNTHQGGNHTNHLHVSAH
jgi:hypothetical protein